MKKIINKIIHIFGYRVVKKDIISVDLRQIRNLFYYNKIFSLIGGVNGCVVECGVGKGRSFSYLSSLIFFEGKGRQIWGFDSFEGFPEPTKEDKSDRMPIKGEWSGVSTSDIESTLSNIGLPFEFLKNNVNLKKGFFEESLANYDNQKIALLHVDVDLYQSYKLCLEKFYPLLEIGGIVMFDEYGSPKWPGATQAVNEYFGDKVKNFKKDDLSGKYYFVKK